MCCTIPGARASGPERGVRAIRAPSTQSPTGSHATREAARPEGGRARVARRSLDGSRIICEWLFEPATMAVGEFAPGDIVELWDLSTSSLPL